MTDSVKVYDKLIRDKVIDILRAKGLKFQIHRVASDLEYKRRLFDKLKEESKELFDNPESLEEFVDIIEVIRSLKPFFPGWEKKADEKKEERGGFDDRVVLEYVQETVPPPKPDEKD